MRALALFGLIAGCPACAESPPEAGPVAFWCADRDGGAIHGLDDRLCVARTIAAHRPVFLEPGPSGSLWVVEAARGRAGPHEVVQVDPEAGRGTARVVGAVLAAAAEGERLWFLERRLRDVTLSSVTPAGHLARRVSLPAAVCLSAAPGRVAVGTGTERLLFFETGSAAASPAPASVHRLPGVPVDLRPGPRGLWWVALEEPPRLLLVHEAGGLRWSRPASGDDLLLAGGGDEVELLDGARGDRVAYDLAGVGHDRGRLPLRGISVGIRAGPGRRLYASPGALYSVHERSGRESTQGGFEFSSDVVAVP